MNKRWKQLLMIVFSVALLLPQFGIAQKASAAIANGNYVLKIQTTGGKQWDGAQIATGVGGLNLVAGTSYTFSYDLYTPDQDVAGIVLQTSAYNWIKDSGAFSAASPAWTSYSATYAYTAASGSNIQFVKKGDSAATDAKNITYYIDNFVVRNATSGDVVYSANFEDQAADGFVSSGTSTLSAAVPPQAANNYFLKVQTTGGQQWDGAQIATGAAGLNLVAGTSYTFSYDLYTPDKDIAGMLLQTNASYDWISQVGALTAANPAWTSHTGSHAYTAASGSQIQFAKLGDSGATDTKNITYYIDNFVVKDATSGNVVYSANFDDKATHGFASSGSATLSVVNSTSAVTTTPTINPDVLKLPSIKDTYPNYLMGNIIGPYYMQDSIMPVLKAQFGVVTSENAMKPASLIGTSASTHDVKDLSFNQADKEIQSAIDNGLKVHGHTLVWESQSIPWLNNDKTSSSDSTPSNPGLTAEGAYANMNAYINAVLTHFDGKYNASTQNIISWDVVNEAFSGSVRDSKLDPKDWHSYLKATPWLKATDENYVEQAFKYARAAEPDYNVLLYYNDYSMDDQNKAAAVRDMVKDINDRWAVDHPGKQLIQGVGLQEHNGLGTNPNNQRKTIQMFKNIGVKVSISELDISAGTNSQQTTEQVQAQAAQYARLMQVYTDPNFKDTVQRISIWGLTDTNSWLSSGSPLLFDGNLYPKDAFNAVIDPAKYLANYQAPTKPAGGKTSTAAKGTPSIDGTVDDIWNTTTPIDINVTQTGNTKADAHMPAATARMLWDNGNLYVLAQVAKDPSEPLDKGNANPWEQDSVEVVVDLTNGSSAMYSNASGHYRVRYDGFATVDAGMTDNQGVTTTMTSATTFDATTNSYIVEMQIPFIQITPEIGTKVGFDAQVNDAKAGVRIGAFAWNDATGTAYQDLFKIGTLELAAAPTPPTTSVTGATLDQSTLSLTVGGTAATLTATVLPSNASNKAVTWSSSDSSIATVDNNGVVTAVKAGTATITATTVDGGFTATSVVTVNAANNYFIKVQTTGGQQWDGAQIDTGASGLNLVADTAYTFSFDLYTPDKDVAGIILQTNGNYNWIKNTNALSAANPAWTSYTGTYTYLAASGEQLQFVKAGDSGATDVKNITYYIDNFVVKDATSGNVIYSANFDDKATHGFASSGSATLSVVNSTSAVTTPTLNPDVLKLPSIKDTYPDYLMGNIIGPYYMQDTIMPVIKAQFGVVTSENAMKPASLIGTSASTHDVKDLNFNQADKEVQSAIDNGLKVHGHTLVWEGQSIPWLNNDKTSSSDSTPSNPGLTADGAYANMNAYINAVLTHFDGKYNASTQNIISWDVVNEAFSGSVRDSKLDPKDWHSYLKATPWLKATDENYVEQAFKYARAAETDYNVLLYYNDYSMDDQNKAAAVRDMVKDINDRWAVDHPGKQLIQGVGLQEHNGLGTNPNNQRKTIQMFKNIGVKVSISELDISAGTNSQQTTEQVKAQAAQYARLMQVYTDPAFKDTVQRISFWGLTDTNSWLSSGSPLLFDGNLYPKDAFNAVIDPAKYLENYQAPTKPAGGKTSTAAKGTPSIDGTVDDIWNTTTPIDINVKQAGNTKADTHMPAATARMLWDNGNLYVLAQVAKDPSEPLDKGNANPWEQDSVEVVVDLTNGSSAMYSNASGHYRVRYDGFATVDAGMTDNQGVTTTMTSATTFDATTNSYIVEMQIPFIQITPEIGTKVGFDAQVNDAKAGVRIGAFAWNDATGTAYQDLFKIGTLELVAAKTTTPTPTYIPTPTQESTITVDKNHITAKAQPDSKGTASVTIASSDFQHAVSQSTDRSVTIHVQPAAGVKEVQVNLPTDQVKAISDQIQSIIIDTGLATVTIDPKLLKHNDANGSGNVQLSVAVVDPASLTEAARSQVGGNTVYNFNLSVNGSKITEFTGNDVKVSMDYSLKPGENPNNVVVYYIDDNGKLEIVKNGKYNTATGKVEFAPKHFSQYVAKFNASTFKDVNNVPWAVESIQALEARGMVAGVGTGAFAPNNQVTRAEFIQMLMNALDLNSDKATSTFTDVKEGAWYYQAVASAQQLGIVNGKADGSYGINDAISRQEMAAMLYRAAAKANIKLPNTVNEIKFADDSSISGYAAPAIKALQQAGIVKGMENGTFAPANNATRAQAAVIIYGLFKLM